MRTPPTPLSLALSGTALRPLAASSAFLLALAGCGGGGSSGDAPAPPPAPTPVTLTGTVAVDQAIQNAVVCMDLNANNLCDTGEPASAKTGANGAYSLTYDPAAVTEAQVAAASLIAPMVPGTLADANTTIDTADPTSTATDRAYVLQQVPGKSGQINPLTTLVATGVKAGLAEAVARTNAAAQLAIAPAKIDNYQDDPTYNAEALVDNARLMAKVTAAALEAGAILVVSPLAAADASPGNLTTLNYAGATDYFVRSASNLAVAAGATSADSQDFRTGLTAGQPTAVNLLYQQAYLTPTGWTRCTDSISTSTRGVPSRDTFCNVSKSVGFPVFADIAGQSMADVVTAMQADTRTNTINNGISTTNLLAALGTATFRAGSTTRVRTNVSLNQPIFINNTNNDGRPQAEATTLEQLIAAKPASGVNLATAAGSLSLGLSTSAQLNLRVAFTGTTDDKTGTVQFYECKLNAAGTEASNCQATDTGNYAIETVHGARVMRFAGHAPTTYSNQISLYAEVKGTAGITNGDWVFRARQAKPTFTASFGSNKRLNGTAWTEMKKQLGL